MAQKFKAGDRVRFLPGLEDRYGASHVSRNELIDYYGEEAIVHGYYGGYKDRVNLRKKDANLPYYYVLEDCIDFVKPYNLMSVKELRDIAKEKEVIGRWEMTKKQLLDIIEGRVAKKVPPVRKAKGSIGQRTVKGAGGCASYSVAWSDGTEQVNWYTACHAGMSLGPYNTKASDGSVLVAVVDDVARNVKEPYKSIHSKWLRYMLNDSPFAPCFLTKKVEKAYKSGVYMNLNHGKSRIVTSQIALRQGNEHRDRVYVWNWLVEQGFDERLADAGSQFFNWGKNKPSSEFLPNGAHAVFSHYQSVEEFCKFFKEGFFIDMKEPPLKDVKKKDQRSYLVCQSICGRGEYGSVPKHLTTMQTLLRALDHDVKGVGWTQEKIVRPESIIKFVKDLGERIKNAK